MEVDMIKVSARSRPTAVAGAIAGVIRDYGKAEAQAIGAGAVNQAVKAIAIAVGYLQPDEIRITCVPCFNDVLVQGEERTAIKFNISAETYDGNPLPGWKKERSFS